MPWSPMDLCEVLLGIFFYPAWIFRLDLGIMKIDWFITVPRWQNHIIFHLYMPSSNLRILLPITQINKSTRKNRVKFFPPIADTTVECTNRNYHHWPLATTDPWLSELCSVTTVLILAKLISLVWCKKASKSLLTTLMHTSTVHVHQSSSLICYI